jgi:hypothetical protein
MDKYGKVGRTLKCITKTLYYGHKLTVGKVYSIMETKDGRDGDGKDLRLASIIGDDRQTWWVALDAFDLDDDIKSGALWTTV